MVQNPFNGIERSSEIALALSTPINLESIQWNWKASMKGGVTPISSKESIQWNWKSCIGGGDRGGTGHMNPFNGIERRYR